MNQTTGSLASFLGAELIGPADLPIGGLAAIDRAVPGELTFIRSARYAERWRDSAATAALVSRAVRLARDDRADRALLLVEDAEAAVHALLPLFAPPPPRHRPGVHPSAIVDPAARIDPTAHVGPLSVVGPGAVIGPGAVLIAQVYLGRDAVIGPETVLHPGVRVLDRCVIGTACQLWPNVVIGADGFGYRPAPDGKELLKIPHLGNVVVGDRVEIGAASSIDRGKFGSTLIGDGTKIDNHCQIAHNCTIGRSVIICGMAGIAGSVTIADGAVIAGHVGIADNVVVGAGAIVAAKAGVISDVPPGATYFGTPAGPHREQMRSFAALRQLPEALRRLERVERALSDRGG